MDVRRALTAMFIALLLAAASVAQAEVTDYLGLMVTAVSVRTEGRSLTEPRLVALIQTAVGQPLEMRKIRESIAHLFSLAQYEDVRVFATRSGEGVALVYELVPMHPVQAITFSGGGPGIARGRLRQMLVERFGATPRVQLVPEMARAVEQSVHEVGYLQARVTPRVDVRHAPEQTAITFAIEPGARARLGAITVDADANVTAAQLMAALDMRTGQPYVPERLVARVEQYVEQRRSQGYFEARLSITPTVGDDQRTVSVRLSLTQGPMVKVIFTGDPVPPARREQLAPIAREGSADEDLLEDSSNRIQEFFQSQGYRDATATHTREVQPGELVVTFAVHKGRQYRVEAIDIAGNVSVPSEELLKRLRVQPGQPFAAAALDADLAQLEELYRRAGFTAARADATTGQVPVQSGDHVAIAIRIQITENLRTMVNSVRFQGNEAVPSSELSAGLRLAPGQPFSVRALAEARDAIELKYANLGYQNVTVEARPGVSADSTHADAVFVVHEGRRVLVDRVLIVGNDRTGTATIERALQFKPGDPLGMQAISESQRRLAALGLFRRARITQLGRGDQAQRDVLVTVEEAPLTTVGYGGGFAVRSRVLRSASDPTVASERLEFAPRASFEIGRRNLFGTNRSVNLFTSASLHSRNSPVFAGQEQTTTTDANGYGFPEYRLLGQFRQPRVLGSPADFRVTSTLEQQIRSSFNFSRRSVAAEIAMRLPGSISASGGYQIQRTRVFNQSVETSQRRDVDRLFPKVRLSSFVGSIIRDTRDDAVDPTGGLYLSGNGQIAARGIGSEVGFLKSFFTAQAFRSIARQRAIVAAASARLGAAVGFPSAAGGSRDLPASERFFAGGDTTVRGFALDRLGVRHDPSRASDTLDAAGFPLGGNALLLFNGELRVPVRNSVKVVGFADVGNIFKTVSEVTLRELRPALGFGFRYKSPVGPLRFDLGFKVPRRAGESRTSWFITFGEAF